MLCVVSELIRRVLVQSWLVTLGKEKVARGPWMGLIPIRWMENLEFFSLEEGNFIHCPGFGANTTYNFWLVLHF